MEPKVVSEPAPEEVMIAQWEQPTRLGMLSGRAGLGKVWLIAAGAAALLIAAAVWLRELNLGLAGGVILVAAVALQTQGRNAGLPVTITNLRIIVGKRDYQLSNLAGYWLADQGDAVEINLENTKPGLLPMTFLYSKPSPDEARDTLSQVLPELEPREKRLGDKVGNYFKL